MSILEKPYTLLVQLLTKGLHFFFIFSQKNFLKQKNTDNQQVILNINLKKMSSQNCEDIFFKILFFCSLTNNTIPLFPHHKQSNWYLLARALPY